MNGGTLVVCPQCLSSGQTRVLGSIDAVGDLIIRRFKYAGGTTTIRSSEFTIICPCGFGTTVTATRNGHDHYLYPNPIPKN